MNAPGLNGPGMNGPGMNGPGMNGPAGPSAGGAISAQSRQVDAPRSSSSSPSTTGPRKVRLTVARVDPWSILKLSFLLSVALGIGLVTSSLILWEVLNGMGVFTRLNETLREIGGANSQFDLYDYVGLSRVVSLSTFVAVINVVIIMALSTLGAVLYNLAGSLVGGLQVTLSDD
jgi:hypothetical protein